MAYNITRIEIEKSWDIFQGVILTIDELLADVNYSSIVFTFKKSFPLEEKICVHTASLFYGFFVNDNSINC